MDLRRSTAQSLTVEVDAPPGGPHARVRLAGELDTTTAGALADAVEATLRTASPKLVELHTAAVTFVDSTGIRCLLTCLAAARDADSRLRLVEPSRQVTWILNATGLLDLFGLPPEPARPDDRSPAGRRGPHRGRPVVDVLADSAMIRQTAQETRARARAVRESSPMRAPGEGPAKSST